MAAQNVIGNKYYEGTLAGGQGPILGQHVDKSGEESTLHGGEGKKLSIAQGPSGGGKGSEGPNFDLNGKGYTGPENWNPKNLGDVTPTC